MLRAVLCDVMAALVQQCWCGGVGAGIVGVVTVVVVVVVVLV